MRTPNSEATTDCIWTHQNIPGVGMSAWLFLFISHMNGDGKASSKQVSYNCCEMTALSGYALGSRGQRTLTASHSLNLRIFGVSSPDTVIVPLTPWLWNNKCLILAALSPNFLKSSTTDTLTFHLEAGSGSRTKGTRAFVGSPCGTELAEYWTKLQLSL